MPFCVCLGLRDYQLHVYAAESGKTGEERCPRFLCPPLATCLSSQPYEFPVPASDRCARLLAALGSGGCMAQRPSHLRHDHRRARRKKRSILINKMWNENRVETYRWYVFFYFCFRASLLPPCVGNRWCEVSLCICFQGRPRTCWCWIYQLG